MDLKNVISKVKRKIAVDKSESKEIYRIIKDIPKGDKRDNALQKEVEEREFNKEDIKEMMYDLEHTLKMINIKTPSIQKTKIKIDYAAIAEIISEDFDDDLFHIELEGHYHDKSDPDLSVTEISVNFDKLYNSFKKNNKEIFPEKLSEEDKIKISELIDSEIVDKVVKDVDLEYQVNEVDSREVTEDVEISIDITGGKYKDGIVNFKTKNVKVRGTVL